MNQSEFDERIASVHGAVAEAARRAGREPGSVDILPVTKGFPAAVVRLVAGAGFTAVGENRVGEAEAKRAELGEAAAGIAWHM
ncbi:MAG TPA: YggS family pyridoxal phosphate-dependent enzyme, partial [Alphaproteobacteria bacterium]|nr:YggS family pyridoxal phosphate-dependent enzyme [Alphaproteobacteria bacterium]